jgi:uncharacterized protein
MGILSRMDISRSRGIVLALGGLGLVALVAVGMGTLPLPEADAGASLWLVFLTGLSVGGLSCLAVQGGLLAALIARRHAPHEGAAESAAGAPVKAGTGSAAPRDRYGDLGAVVQFLVAKSAAYTVLGGLLGLFGSHIPLALHGWMLIGAGLFMVLTALQLYDVHPALRHLTITPPKRIQRLVRRQTKRSEALAPLALGALTIFIPCGVTVAMEVLAVASHSALRGAAVMLAFTLGTAPLFLLVGAAASQLEKSATSLFRPIAAVTIVVIALVSIVSGARLLGFDPLRPGGPAAQAGLVTVSPPGASGEPVGTPGVAALGASTSGVGPAGARAPEAGTPPNGAGASNGEGPGGAGGSGGQAVQEVTVQVGSGGYVPARIRILPGIPTRLRLVTDNTRGCIRSFVIPSLGIERILPATGTETVDLPAIPAGRIDFMCSMGMYTGVIEVGGPT